MRYWYYVAPSNKLNVKKLIIFSDPLVITNRSETCVKAVRRYQDTIQHLCQWYRVVPWENDSSLRTVNHYHRAAAEMLKNSTRNERHENAEQQIRKLPPEDRLTNIDSLDAVLLQNMKDVSGNFESEAFNKYQNCDLIFSQFDMSMVHMAFFETIIMDPRMVTFWLQ
jgi:hypothetical protein